MTGPLRVDTQDGFDLVVIDSPANRNALSLALLEALTDEVRSSAMGSGRGLILRHTGPAFCSGVDLKERRALGAADASHSIRLAQLLRELWHYPKPVVVSVDGAVRGGGLGILACADIVLSTASSSFAYSESRVGVAPALVMAVTLPLGTVRALVPRLLDGSVFHGEEAQALGLVSSVIDSEQALELALAELRQGAPEAQAAIKRLARQWAAVDMDGLIDQASILSAQLFAGAEAIEGVTAFSEKRDPSWAVSS